MTQILMRTLFLIAFLLPHPLGFGIQFGSKMEQQERFVQIDIDATGRLEIKTHEVSSFLVVCPGEELLREREIQLELELSNSQITDLEQVIEQAYEKYHSVFMLSEEQRPQARNSLFDDTKAQVDEILLPAQAERFEEIQRRLDLRARGLIPFLRNNVSALQLDLDEPTWARVEEVLKRYREEDLSQLQKLCRDLESELLHPLSSSQLKALKKQFVVNEEEPINPDVFLAQLVYALEMKEDFTNLDNTLRELTPFFATAPRFQYRSFSGGQFSAPANSPELYWYGKFSGLDLSRLAISSEARTELHQSYQYHINPHAAQTSLQDWAKHFLDPIGSEDREAFLAHFLQESFYRFGVTALLLHGPLGADLEIQPIQKKEIKDRLEAAITKLQVRFQDMERELLSDIYQALGKENSRKLQQALGPPMKHINPAFTLLLQSPAEQP